MPVPAPRDPGATRDILTGWLGDPARLPGARIADLRTPEFTGYSSEILMLDVEHDGGTGMPVPESRMRISRYCSSNLVSGKTW